MNKAVLVGINKFSDPTATLQGCVNDAKHLSEILMAHGWKKRDIRLLCDERATKTAILERLGWLVKNAQPGDNLFFSFSGHGSQVVDRDGDELSDELDEILCPYDFPKWWDDPLSDDTIGSYIKSVPKGAKLVLLIDACHSGSADRGLINFRYRKAKRVAPPVDVEFRTDMDSLSKFTLFGVARLPQFMSGSDPDVHLLDGNHLLLSGCRDNQTSSDAVIKGVPQGAMTWAFKAVLEEMPDVTWGELHARMKDKLSKSRFEQVPQLTCALPWLVERVFA